MMQTRLLLWIAAGLVASTISTDAPTAAPTVEVTAIPCRQDPEEYCTPTVEATSWIADYALIVALSCTGLCVCFIGLWIFCTWCIPDADRRIEPETHLEFSDVSKDVEEEE